ncbi:C40 family peptidase [Roseibium sp. CAU 1637]|uniref:C40 family peptidase n=1 Tax=Roseibium limicola TaxID=2816037 RepID=A0A939EM97_9HYPH|nr:NlpC/P60 family protein [Roseibium limicola]MBO0345191.1 C40 family peptidase [Roseibium limicola]
MAVLCVDKPALETARILKEARSWLGTPYRHQARCKGQGCDCLGLLRGVWRALYGPEPQPVPAYQPDWVVADKAEPLVTAASRWLVSCDLAPLRPGMVVLFRWRDGLPARHVGILSSQDQMIHAFERVGVVESPLVPAWQRRISHAYRFPPIPDNPPED